LRKKEPQEGEKMPESTEQRYGWVIKHKDEELELIKRALSITWSATARRMAPEKSGLMLFRPAPPKVLSAKGPWFSASAL